jgi:hypothetical protein
MNDRPDFDPEKIYDFHRSKWHDDSKYYMSELEFLEQKIEAKLDQINEQLSALFQLAAKTLSESMDAVIETDYRTKLFADISIAIASLQIRIEKLEARENHLKGLQEKPNNE